MKKISLFIILVSIFCVLWLKKSDSSSTLKVPIPTEFVEKKTKRKNFKQLRKDYIRQMHRSNPNDDWQKIDSDTRDTKTAKVREIRKSISNTFNSHLQMSNYEKVSSTLNGYWQERGSNNLAGRILTSEIDWDNNLIYCASDGGNIWRGTLNGENWTSLTDYFQIKGIHLIRILEFDNTRRILFSNSKNVYYTDDEGLTLEKSNGLEFLDNGGTNYLKRTIVTHNDIIYLLATEGSGNWDAIASLYKSTDYGRNFSKIITLDSNEGMSSNQTSDHYDIWTSRYFETDIFLVHNNEFFSINSSNQLQFISNIPTSQQGENILTGGMQLNSPFFYVHIGGNIYFSYNGGNTWLSRGESPQWYFNIQNSFNSSNIDRDKIYWGGIEVFQSSNSGNDWVKVNNWWDYYGSESTNLHADIPEVRFFLDPDYNEVALVSTDGGLYFSNNALETVQNLSMNGLGVSQYYSTYTKRSSPYNIYAGAQDQGFQRSISPQDGIFNFEQSISGDYGHLSSGDMGKTIWCNYPGFTMYYSNPTTDGGGLTLDFPGTGHLWLAPLIEDPYNPNQAYLAGGGLDGGNHLFELTAGNSSINYIEKPFNFSSTISAMGYSPIEPNHRYVLTNNGSFYHSSDNGDNWQKSLAFEGPNAHYFYGSSIWASPNFKGKVIIGGSGYSNPPVYISYDHGITFQNFNKGLPNTLVFNIAGSDDDKYLFAATEVGPYVYINEENTWKDLAGISAPDQTYWSVEYIPELTTARFGTYGRGIWDFIINVDEIILGDSNLDGYINVQDLILLVNFVINTDTPSEDQFISSDMNHDDMLSIFDIIIIVNIIIGN